MKMHDAIRSNAPIDSISSDYNLYSPSAIVSFSQTISSNLFLETHDPSENVGLERASLELSSRACLPLHSTQQCNMQIIT